MVGRRGNKKYGKDYGKGRFLFNATRVSCWDNAAAGGVRWRRAVGSLEGCCVAAFHRLTHWRGNGSLASRSSIAAPHLSIIGILCTPLDVSRRRWASCFETLDRHSHGLVIGLGDLGLVLRLRQIICFCFAESVVLSNNPASRNGVLTPD